MQSKESVVPPPAFPRRLRLVQVGTSHLSIGLMRGQPRYFRKTGFDVWVVSSPGPRLDATAVEEGVHSYALPMTREISGLGDVVSLWKLTRLMRRLRPTITNVSTPKAGLIAGIAAMLNRVPCRVYTLRGLRCETAKGWKRALLLIAERMACRCAHRVICVSQSLREKAIVLGLAPPQKLVVLALGSSNGVDAERFAPTPARVREAAALRNSLGIPAGAPVVGFVGRFTRDKGMGELIDAYFMLRGRHPDLHLLLVGDIEEGDPISDDIRKRMHRHPQIVCTGTVDDPAPYYHAMDILALPTYREGFPNTVLEAQAAARPVVTTWATGARDSIQDGITGILVPVGDANSLCDAISKLIQEPALARRLGSAGCERVRQDFRQEVIWKALEVEFLSLLQAKGLPVPSAMYSHSLSPLDSPVNLASQ